MGEELLNHISDLLAGSSDVVFVKSKGFTIGKTSLT